MSSMFLVRASPRSVPPKPAVAPSPLCMLHAHRAVAAARIPAGGAARASYLTHTRGVHGDCARIPAGGGSRLASHTPRPPSLRLGRAVPWCCPTPTSGSSAARGRATPSGPRTMARPSGGREAATEAPTEVCVRPGQSPWRLPVPQPATCAWRPHLHRRERGAKKHDENEHRKVCTSLTEQ